MMSTVERTLNRSYPAEPRAVTAARHEVAELARAAGASETALDAIRLAVSEAITNAVVHAYPERPGTVHLTAAVAGEELWVLVSDDGCGLEAKSRRPGLGVGLALISQVADALTVGRRSSSGVEVRMRFDLAGSVRGHVRGSVSSAISPASPSFSTTT